MSSRHGKKLRGLSAEVKQMDVDVSRKKINTTAVKNAALVIVCAAMLLMVAVPEDGEAQVAVGLAAGDPSGLSLVIEDRLSLLIGWSLDRHTSIFLDVWLWRQLLPSDVRWYLGAGGAAEFYNDDSNRGYEMERDQEDPTVGLGVRVPVGIRYSLQDRLELMSEVSGNIIFFPEFTLDGHAYIGLRFVL